MTMRLGKLPPRVDERTLQFAKYAPALRPPKAMDWSHGLKSWGVMLNDQLGCCTIAAKGHAIQDFTVNAGAKEVTVSNAAILKSYEAVSGYNPADPNSDVGADMLTTENYWRKTGIGGHKIAAFVQLTPGNYQHVEESIWLFGGVDIGLQLPISAQTQINAGKPWSQTFGPDSEPGSWGGHDVWIVGYNAKGLTCVTWGQLQVMTWGFWHAYTDEAYAVITQEWIEKNGKSPGGFDWATLEKDLQAVTG